MAALDVSGSILLRQARVLVPLMFMAQLPQIPSRHDRRNVSVGSNSFLILIRPSNNIGPQLFRSTAEGGGVGREVEREVERRRDVMYISDLDHPGEDDISGLHWQY